MRIAWRSITLRRRGAGLCLGLSLALVSTAPRLAAQAGPLAPDTSGGGETDLVRLVRQADYHASRGELSLAMARYEEALRAGAGAAVLNRLAELHLIAGSPERAVPLLQRSLAERPGQLPVYSRLGEAFLAMGRPDSAIYYVEEARRLAPGVSSIHSSLGFLYLKTGDLGSARAHIDTALRLADQNPEAHRFLGLYYTEVDSLDSAIAQFARVVEFLPDDVEAYNNIAFLRARQQRYTEALEYYRRAKDRVSDANLLHAINTNMEAVRAIMDGKMRARYILVRTEAAGRDILERLRQGGDFGRLAAQFSIAPNAREGGDLGFFGPGDMLPQVEAAVLKLQVGEISEVIAIDRGVMVIQRLN
ncbi:MAG: tetratricopeptide repeat protein [Gemmatimonadota bacterium]